MGRQAHPGQAHEHLARVRVRVRVGVTVRGWDRVAS